MSIHYLVDTDGKEYFVMRVSAEGEITTASHHRYAYAAWNSARAKSLSEADRRGMKAVYTTCPDNIIRLVIPEDPRPRACWLVK